MNSLSWSVIVTAATNLNDCSLSLAVTQVYDKHRENIRNDEL